MKDTGMLILLGLVFILIQTSFSLPITIPSRLPTNCENFPPTETSGCLKELSTQTLLQSPSSTSPELVNYSSDYLAIDQKGGIHQGPAEKTDFPSSRVIFGRKKKPHILKLSKNHHHPLPGIEPEVSTSPVGFLSTKDELSNNNVPQSSQSSFLIHDFSTGDFVTESHVPMSSELPLAPLVPNNVVPTEQQDTSVVSESDNVTEKKLLPHLTHSIKKHLLGLHRHRPEEEIPAARPHGSIIASLLHKKHHSAEKTPVLEDHSTKFQPDAHISSILLHKKSHISDKIAALKHKAHHRSKFQV